MHAIRRGTLVTKNMLRDGSTSVTSFECLFFVPSFETIFFSVKKLFVKVTGTGVFFRARAHFLDTNNNLMGYCPELLHKSDLYPLVCTIISGDVTRQHAIHDIAKGVNFLENAVAVRRESPTAESELWTCPSSPTLEEGSRQKRQVVNPSPLSPLFSSHLYSIPSTSASKSCHGPLLLQKMPWSERPQNSHTPFPKLV